MGENARLNHAHDLGEGMMKERGARRNTEPIAGHPIDLTANCFRCVLCTIHRDRDKKFKIILLPTLAC